MANRRDPYMIDDSTDTYGQGDSTPLYNTMPVPDPNGGATHGGLPDGPPTYDPGPRPFPTEPDTPPRAPINNQESEHASAPNYEQQMKDKLGSLYTPGALEELRHHDYDPGWMDRIVNKENLRGNNAPGSEYHDNGQGGYLTGPKATTNGFGGGGSGSGGGYSGGGGAGAGTGSGGPSSMNDIMAQLAKLFPNGAFNKDIVNSRMSSVRDSLNQSKKQSLANNQAYLADRGLVGSGPEATADANLEGRINQQTNSAYNDIYAGESQQADARMMHALSLATGMSTAQAQQAIDQFRANTEKELGLGGLALGNKNADNSYRLGQGGLALGNWNGQANYRTNQDQIGLGRDQLTQKSQNDRMSHIIELLNSGHTLDDIIAGGYI